MVLELGVSMPACGDGGSARAQPVNVEQNNRQPTMSSLGARSTTHQMELCQGLADIDANRDNNLAAQHRLEIQLFLWFMFYSQEEEAPSKTVSNCSKLWTQSRQWHKLISLPLTQFIPQAASARPAAKSTILTLVIPSSPLSHQATDREL